jgi:hypothetical protein
MKGWKEHKPDATNQYSHLQFLGHYNEVKLGFPQNTLLEGAPSLSTYYPSLNLNSPFQYGHSKGNSKKLEVKAGTTGKKEKEALRLFPFY